MRAGSQIASGQSIGQRERQEDRLGTVQLPGARNTRAFVLADGMGGHARGDVAADLATKAFLASLKKRPFALDDALSAANRSIRDATASDGALNGMGSTLVGAIVADASLRWISVGDSPLMLLRDGRLFRLNADHSMREILADMVKAGRLSADDAAHDPQRNALRSAVSGNEIELIDAPGDAVPLETGDVIVLASDGIETLTEDEIVRIAQNARAGGARRIVADLLAEVDSRERKHQDNTSIIAYVHGNSAGGRAGFVAALAVVVLAAVLAVVLILMPPWKAAVSQHPVPPKGHGHAHH
jgi:serine/threonine protein phosphatase PrpC